MNSAAVVSSRSWVRRAWRQFTRCSLRHLEEPIARLVAGTRDDPVDSQQHCPVVRPQPEHRRIDLATVEVLFEPTGITHNAPPHGNREPTPFAALRRTVASPGGTRTGSGQNSDDGGMSEHAHRHGETPGFEETAVHDAAYWDARYASAPAIWSGRPNPQLVAEAVSLVPSTALDAGCGEGADAVWLAGRGWRVTAVDISAAALERAADHARTMGAAVADMITWRRADLTTDVDFEEKFGLVSAQFMHVPLPDRDALHRRLANLVAPGGTLLVVGHHPSDLDTAPHIRPRHGDVLFLPEEITALLQPASWTVVAAESRPRTTIDGDGRTVQVADAVLVARRLEPASVVPPRDADPARSAE